MFKEGRHIYTFENICLENKDIALGDKTTKIFLNTTGTMDDVSDDLKEFLNYVHTGIPSDSDFIKSVDREVKSARVNREWRLEYMKWQLYLQAERDAGMAAGMEAGRIIEQISLIRKKLSKNLSPEEITDMLESEIDFVNTVIHLINLHPDRDDEQIYEVLCQKTYCS